MKILLLAVMLTGQIPPPSPPVVPAWSAEYKKQWHTQCMNTYAEAMDPEPAAMLCECLQAGAQGHWSEYRWQIESNRRLAYPYRVSVRYERLLADCSSRTEEWFDYLREYNKLPHRKRILKGR
jgi:hypothetical protein